MEKCKTIAMLEGDGIGPEIMESARMVLERICAMWGHQIACREGLVGGAAYEKYGEHLPEETVALCRETDAILFGAVGGPVDEQDSPKWKDSEKKVILGLRKQFDLFANIRPLRSFPPVYSASPLREKIVRACDVVIVRELVSGIYFGEHRRIAKGGKRAAEDVNYYHEDEIRRIVQVGFRIASGRSKRLAVVDKANVLETSRLWREIAEEVAREHPDIAVEFLYVDNAAMQLVCAPESFDVIVTENMFGDILSDLGGAVVGSLGLLPSASLNEEGFGLYEPVHGSAPDIAGTGVANPTAQILSLALLLDYSFGLQEEARAIERAVVQTWQDGIYTKDVSPDSFVLGKEFAKEVCSRIEKHIL